MIASFFYVDIDFCLRAGYNESNGGGISYEKETCNYIPVFRFGALFMSWLDRMQ